MGRSLSGNAGVFGDDADRASIDIEKYLVAFPFDADHGAELMRGDDDLARADLHAVVREAAAVIAAGHDALQNILRLLERPAAELDLARADHELAGRAGGEAVRTAASQNGAVEIRHADFDLVARGLHDLPFDEHRAADERSDELMRGPVVDFVRRRVLEDLAALHDHDVIFFFQAEDGIRDVAVTGVQTCALPICRISVLKRAFGLRRCRYHGM